MAEKFLMPKLSPTMEEGQISRWLKNEGETFESGETLAEVDTDKATMEMTALKGGTLLKILKAAGETALLGETIAITGKAGEDFAALLDEAAREITGKPAGLSDAAIRKALDPRQFVNERNGYGGTSPRRVRQMIASRRRAHAKQQQKVDSMLGTLASRDAELLKKAASVASAKA